MSYIFILMSYIFILISYIFIPTTPNPTSGYLLLIPQSNILELNMSVIDGMKLIISGGVLEPKYKYN